jgi:hypothetical protein
MPRRAPATKRSAKRPRRLSVTIGEMLRWLMPDGTLGPRIVAFAITGSEGTPRNSWAQAPIWPPDLFCVAATLVDASGCYTEPGLLFSRNDVERTAKRKRAEASQKAGKAWRETGQTPAVVDRLWRQLVRAPDAMVCSAIGEGQRWKLAALQLMAIADEACREIGFLPDNTPPNEPATAAIRAFQFIQRGGSSFLNLPESLCYAVPPDVACVLPKSLTPAVGCTLRSLSLNVALLPSKCAVGAEWYIATEPANQPSAANADGPLNLLLVPYPFDISAADFAPSGPASTDGADGYFTLRQGWLPPARSRNARIAALIASLVRSAQAEGERVHGIVLPETSLAAGMADPVANILAQEFPDLELLICGTLADDGDHGVNEAAVIRLAGGKVVATLVQKKHHRWRLTPSQIAQYRLEGSLPGDRDRWERIDVSGRCIQFGVNRQDAVIAALVCEDLARFDPMLPVLTAVGPNLVVALLMDGPQLVARWPGRYATVLAEDPGSAVLTLTSLGMLKRCRRANEPVNRCIALWRDSQGDTMELHLPEHAHALLLSLKSRRITQKTLDLRSESGVVTFHASGVREVVLPPSRLHSWLEKPRPVA